MPTELRAEHQSRTFLAPSRTPLSAFVELWLLDDSAVKDMACATTSVRGNHRDPRSRSKSGR